MTKNLLNGNNNNNNKNNVNSVNDFNNITERYESSVGMKKGYNNQFKPLIKDPFQQHNNNMVNNGTFAKRF